MALEITVGGRTRRVEITRHDGHYELVIDGASRRVDASTPEPGVLHLLLDGESYEVDVRRTKEGQDVTLYGTRYDTKVVDERQKALLALGGAGGGQGGPAAISTAMPGKIVTILVQEGQIVEAGQGIIVVEAMKMENELKATVRAVVTQILVSQGQSVEGGARLVVLGAAE